MDDFNNEMIYVTASLYGPEGLWWRFSQREFWDSGEPYLRIQFVADGRYRESGLVQQFLERLSKEENPFIAFKGGKWLVDIARLKVRFPDIDLFDWLPEKVIHAHYEYFVEEKLSSINSLGFRSTKQESTLTLAITPEEVSNSMPKRIFLSHKSANKPRVREFASTLREIGLDPWLDEDDMPAGRKLNRSLLQGMEDSCAAVFFVTPEYVDENFLESEIDYAIDQKREKGDAFSIITLEMLDSDGNKGVVPRILRQYVWKTIGDGEDLKALREILKALPFETKIPH